MPDVARKIIWSVLLSIPPAIGGLVAREVLQTWGVLSPFSEWLGGWLKMHVSPPQAGWTVAGIVTLATYAALLWLVWKRHRIPQATNSALAGISEQLSFSSQSTSATQKAAEPEAVLITNRYMTAYEALHYLADDLEWGDQIRQYVKETERFTFRKNPLLKSQSEFKRIAEQGKIEATGRINGEGPHVLIPATYWMSAILVLSNNLATSESAPAVPNPDGIPQYKDIKIVRADVERAWPPPPKRSTDA